jgi:N-glycosylase/DNA lyase
VGFICSSNNNIARISQLVEKLCLHFGPLISNVGKQAYYDFPKPSALTGADIETKLRDLGFGYRAKYLWKTALAVDERGIPWLENLRNPEKPLLNAKPKPAGDLVEGGREGYRAAHEQLLELQGVGPKVADCVCLMGLGWGEAVPVDTHVWQIAQRDYKFGKGKHASLTKATYDAIGNKFRALWGEEAGWAHSVLFTADLRAFAERLTEVKEEKKTLVVVKAESDGTIVEKVTVKTVKTEKRIKREHDDDLLYTMETKPIKRQPKRRRRS